MKVFCFSLLLLCFITLSAQVDNNILESLNDIDNPNEKSESLLEAAENFYNNLQKYNINEISQEALILLGFSNFQIFCLKDYLRRSGDMLSLNELAFVNGMDEKTIEKVKPFLYAERVTKLPVLRFDSILKKAKQSLRFQYSQGLQQPYGYTRTDGKGFKGDNFSSSFRYLFKYYERLEFSIVADKDAGEPLYYKQKTYGFDHYNISLTIKDLNKTFKQLTIGDYRLNISSGLAVNQHFSLGYFSSYYGAKNFQSRIMPSRSTSEYDYNKGIATKFQIKNFDIYAFFSYNSLDYNGKTIQKTGYHRTKTELEQKDSNNILMYGTSMQYINKGLTIGGTFIMYHLSDSLRRGSQKYMQRNFQGKDNNILSINASYNYSKMLLFAETAKDKDNKFASLLGLQLNLSYKTNLSLIFRDYSSYYNNLYANAIGYHSNNKNERGLYIDYSHYVSKRLSYYLGADIYYFPFIAYRAYKASWGQKFKAQVDYNPHYKHLVNIYMRVNNHQYNYKNNISDTSLENNIICQASLRYKYSFNDYIRTVYRIGYSHSFNKDSKSNQGFYNYLELILKKDSKPLGLNIRYTYFNCQDYDNRFYVYEYSLPIIYSSNMLYNTGNKFYVMLSYRVNTNFDLHIRYSYTRFSNSKSISSGNSLINSNKQQYLSGQIFYKF